MTRTELMKEAMYLIDRKFENADYGYRPEVLDIVVEIEEEFELEEDFFTKDECWELDCYIDERVA